jgi:hypothetical protein
VLTLYAIGVGLLAVAGGQIVLSGMSEGYCHVWPSIGTRFAGDYSEGRFARVKPGMSHTDVLRLLGEPLSKGFNGPPAPSGWTLWRRGDETWQYARDTSSRGGDWAWLSREIVFRDGLVVQTVRWTYYD